MSYFCLLLTAVAATLIAYGIGIWYSKVCQHVEQQFSCSLLTVAILVGLLTSSIFYVIFPPSPLTCTNNAIIVGTTGDFPPITFIQNGKPIGFDIDLMHEIGKRINKPIEIRNMSFDALLPSLQTGSIDVIASGLTATPERAKHALFTTPYIEDNPLIIVSPQSDPIKTLTDLNDKKVVVNQGYTADLYMSTIPGPHLTRLKTVADAFLALKSKRVAAFVTAKNTVAPFFEQYGSDQFHIALIPDTDEHASLAITPQKSELLHDIQSALESMKDDGTLQKLKKLWGV